jgi:hypothetical protein
MLLLPFLIFSGFLAVTDLWSSVRQGSIKSRGEIEREQISTTTQEFNITNLRVNFILYLTINKLNPFSHPKRKGEYSNFNQNKRRIYIYCRNERS